MERAPGNLDLKDPKIASELFKAAQDYRVKHFEREWKRCVAYDEHDENAIGEYEAEQKDKKLFPFAIKLPLVSMNNARKCSSLSTNSVKPKIISSQLQSAQISEVRGHVLRWFWRMTDAQDEMADAFPDLVSVGTGWLQVAWDPMDCDGLGGPQVCQRSFWDIYVDPKRRHRDLNRDCDWVFDVRYYTLAELKLYWPDDFKDIGSAEGTTGVEDQNRQATALFTDQISQAEGGVIPIARMELSTSVEIKGRKQRRVFVGILDPQRERWLENEPVDNSAGRYSYIPVTIRLRRDHAYPVPPNKREIIFTHLADAFLGLGVSDALRTIFPQIWVKGHDPLVEKSLKDVDYGKPGHKSTYSDSPPTVIGGQSDSGAMRMGQFFISLANESSQVAAVQRGEAPTGVVSGRAIGYLQAYADLPMGELVSAFQRAAQELSEVAFALIQEHMTDTRYVVSDQEAAPLPINMAESHPHFKVVEELIQKNEATGFVCARYIDPKSDKESPQLIYSDVETAAKLVEGNAIATYEKVINGLAFGSSEIAVIMRREPTEQEKVERASLMRNMGALDLLGTLRDMGIEDPESRAAAVINEQEALKLGTMLVKNPQILQILQSVMQNPLLQKMASDPQFSGAVKTALANQAAQVPQ